MGVKLTDLQCKEVICVSDGRRLGFVSDVQIEVPEGNVCAIVVPGSSRHLGVLGCREEYIIPWSSIRRIGPDIILVEVRCDECRYPRQKGHGR